MAPQLESNSRDPRQRRLATASALIVLTPLAAAVATAQPPEPAMAPAARTPIQHVVVIIGENHSFDNVFGT
jgi:phospholipase C